MKAFKVSLLVLILASETHAKWNSNDQLQATTMGQQQGNSMATSAQEGAGVQSTQYDSLQQSSVDTTKNSQKGQTVATIMKVGFFAAGAYYATQCGSQNYGACAIAVVMVGMGLQSSKSAKSFDAPIAQAWENSCTYSSLGCGQTPNNPYTAALTPGVINSNQAQADLQAIKTGLSQGGYEVDINSGKAKDKNGKPVATDPASLQASLGAGYGDLMNKVQQIEKDAKAKVDKVSDGSVTAALGLEGGGSGMGSATLTDTGGYGDGSNSASGLASKYDKLRKPAQAKGLTKNFNGEPIGVASDSIFEMMSRRYQLKNNQKTFIGLDVR